MKKQLAIISPFLLLTACVGPKQLGMTVGEWTQLPPAEQQRLENNYKTIQVANQKMVLVAGGAPLHADISGGTAKFPPDFKAAAYQALSFTLNPGSCKQLPVRAASPNNAMTVLKACYSNNIFFVDPSRYNKDKEQASIYINAQPLWRSGFMYNDLSSDGYVGLSHVNIWLKTVKP